MSNPENRLIAYLASNLLAAGAYAVYVIQQYRAGSFNSTTISSDWGAAILILIAVQVLLSVLLAIVVSIITTIKTREDEAVQTDERDRLIELKADRVSYTVFGIGFLLAMIVLAVGMPPLVMFNLIVFSVLGAGIIGYITRLYLYRRGF